MMKRIAYFSMIVFLTLSCIKEDYQIPEIESTGSEITSNTSIEAIKNAFDQSGENIYTFPAGDQSVFTVYVVSSDASGNFYKTMVVQDAAANPEHGLEIRVDLKSYFTKYNFGRKLYIKPAGLSITSKNGTYILGFLNQNKVQAIPESLLDDFIIRDTETAEIVPKEMSFSDFSRKHLNQHVRVEKVQFRYDEIGKTFAGEAFDAYTAERVMIQCNNELQSFLSTSSYARFKSLIIPEEKGSFNAVLQLNYKGDRFVLVLNDPENLDFSDPERCDPEFLECDLNNDAGEIFFFEDFENIRRTDDLEDLGWYNINANLNDTHYKKRSVNGNAVMRISAYDTGENPAEIWLITPEIDLSSLIDPVLNFKTRASYDNGSILTVWISTDFNGDVRAASWQQLKAEISVGPNGSNTGAFTDSGNIGLGCIDQPIRIGFRYLGGDPGITTTYEIDKVKIMGN